MKFKSIGITCKNVNTLKLKFPVGSTGEAWGRRETWREINLHCKPCLVLRVSKPRSLPENGKFKSTGNQEKIENRM